MLVATLRRYVSRLALHLIHSESTAELEHDNFRQRPRCGLFVMMPFFLTRIFF